MYKFSEMHIAKIDNGWLLEYSYVVPPVKATKEGERDITIETARVVKGAIAFPNLSILTGWINGQSDEKKQVVHATPKKDHRREAFEGKDGGK